MAHALFRRLIGAAAAVALALGMGPFGGAQQAGSDAFEFPAPSVVVSAGDRADLERDQVMARVLSGKGGQHAVFVTTRLNAPPDALVAWTHAIAELKRSKFALAIGPFSDPHAHPISRTLSSINATSMRFAVAVPATVP